MRLWQRREPRRRASHLCFTLFDLLLLAIISLALFECVPCDAHWPSTTTQFLSCGFCWCLVLNYPGVRK